VNIGAPAIQVLASKLAQLSAERGRRVVIDPRWLLDRSDSMALSPPTRSSPNGSCRLLRAADGWTALNLARESDRDLLPAWIGRPLRQDSQRAIANAVRKTPCATLAAKAQLLGLPFAVVGETGAERPGVLPVRLGSSRTEARDRRLSIVDLSSLWAGPLCGAILAETGASVTRFESTRRPDATRLSAPAFWERLNGRKTFCGFDHTLASDLQDLRAQIATADVVISNARPRALDQLGIQPARMIATNPGLTWVAVTGYGSTGSMADRVAFGDDAAAAGGLLRWTRSGAPAFAGDALADPLTGLAAAVAALAAVRGGGGVLVDASMAHCAAQATAMVRAPGR
jgi:hypothetical protein